MLVIHPHFQQGFVSPQGDTFDFVSGRINTRQKFEFTYGSLSARIQIPGGTGLWPAFWALGNDGNWPDCGEMDVMEYVGEADWTSAAIHGPGYSGEGGQVNKKYFTSGSNVTDWHVYALDWGPDTLLFKVDNELIYRITRPMVEFFGNWVFDHPHFIILNFALGGVYPFKTNGIDTPYFGLPTETVEAIRQDKIKMLVDWVKVVRG